MMQKKTFLAKIAYLSPLIFICVATVALVAPTLQYNINDPNLIVYFSHDEGYRMDVIWKYYSGQTRDSYQGDYEYGLSMLYLSDLARILPFNFTPGTFVLILRWLHLIFWVISFVCLWRLVIYHFGSRWQAALCVIILATRPAFSYFLDTLKPDPIVLFFMIAGLDYTLRIIDHPSRRNLFIAIACSSIALIVKFSGIFLLPAIVIAMFFAKKYKKTKDRIFQRVKIAQILYLFIGLILIFLPLSPILFYVRKATGRTWYEQFGLWGSLLQNKSILYLILAGIFFILSFAIIWLFNKRRKLEKVMRIVNEINSHAFIVFGIFLGFTLLFGFRWLISPQFFLTTYSEIGPYAFGGALKTISEYGLFSALFSNLLLIIKEFDPIVIILFLFYAIIEMKSMQKNLKFDASRLFKRLILAGFIFPFFLFIFLTMTRVAQLHMLPFIVALSVLSIQGIKMFYDSFVKKQINKRIFLWIACILIIGDISFNGRAVISAAINKYHQREDVVFELMKWWRENIPIDARIVADHHLRVYIPAEYKNIRIFKGYQTDRVEQLRNLVNGYHPQLIYYYEGQCGGEPLPPIYKMLPDKKVNLFKSFESKGQYQREPGGKFVIYEVLY